MNAKTPAETVESARQLVQGEVYRALKAADALGFVVTVALEPMQPLAMGHYKMVADVRPSAKMRAAIAKSA